MQWSRRTALRAGLGLGAGALLGACGSGRAADPDGTVHLTYWSWLKDLQLVCDVWNAQRPDVQVEAVWIQPGPDGGYQKMFSSLATGGGPDLAQVELRQTPAFLLVDGLVDTRRYGADAVLDRYEQAILGQVTFNDAVYALPQDWGPTAWFYRTDLLEEIGAEPPQTWPEWAELAREFRATDRYLDIFNPSDGSYFAALAMQAGATWFAIDDDTWLVSIDDDATLETADFFDRAVREDLVSTSLAPFSPGWFAAANEGRLGACMSASWADALIEGAAGTAGLWQVAPMPRWDGGYGSAQLGGSTTAVFSTSPHPAEATEFAIWMTTAPEAIDAQIEHSGIGWSPVPDHIGTPREQPSEFFGGQRYNEEVFVPAAEQQHPDWTWAPTTQQVFNELSDGFVRAVSGGSSLVEACRRTQTAAVEMLTDKGLNARAA
ncbi:extracellular solute-binding protein [Georgenia deserti]|uniref:Extracellular solute-binding protein n=1 Tax=Georgenia deserti TaxID=2093781 RepID=A0ABW4L883_9MICO